MIWNWILLKQTQGRLKGSKNNLRKLKISWFLTGEVKDLKVLQTHSHMYVHMVTQASFSEAPTHEVELISANEFSQPQLDALVNQPSFPTINNPLSQPTVPRYKIPRSTATRKGLLLPLRNVMVLRSGEPLTEQDHVGQTHEISQNIGLDVINEKQSEKIPKRACQRRCF